MVVKEFLPNGAPVYEARQLEGLTGAHLIHLDNGNYRRLGDGKLGEAELAARRLAKRYGPTTANRPG